MFSTRSRTLWLGALLSTQALSLAALPAQTEPATWADLVEARQLAETENKSILLVFTSRDGDAVSTRIQRQLLSNQRFRESIAESLIPLRIELSTSGSGGARPAGPLATLLDDLGMVMVPSLHLLDAQLRPFGHIQYRGQDDQVCIREIRSLLQTLARRDRYLREAEELEGSARARRLDLALLSLGDEVRMIRYLPLIRQLYELDGLNELGIKQRYVMRLDWEDLSSEVPALLHRGDWARVQRKVDAFCKKHDGCRNGRRQQQALYWKATAIMQDKGLKSARSTLLAACKAAPGTGLGQRIQRMLDSLAAPGKLSMPRPIGRW